MKGLPKTKQYNSVAVTVSVRIRCICETALKSVRLWKEGLQVRDPPPAESLCCPDMSEKLLTGT